MLLKETEMIRRATIEDYDAVISILPGKDYDGDYLPDYFHMLMNNQFIKAYVYILDGKIVCNYLKILDIYLKFLLLMINHVHDVVRIVRSLNKSI